MNRLMVFAGISLLFFACNSNEPAVITETPGAALIAPANDSVKLPELPASVIFRNWEIGHPANLTLVVGMYEAWDSENPLDMVEYLGDSIVFDWPNGSRVISSRESVEPILRKWRNGFKSTSNKPISLLSVHNKDLNQDWVMAWVWNRWETAQGKKDSMLFCDNWRIQNNKIVYLNSSENRTSGSLSDNLNKIAAQ